jgi:hypothetical protein
MNSSTVIAACFKIDCRSARDKLPRRKGREAISRGYWEHGIIHKVKPNWPLPLRLFRVDAFFLADLQRLNILPKAYVYDHCGQCGTCCGAGAVWCTNAPPCC